VTIRIGDRVVMRDRYAQRRKCTCRTPDPSWFDGMRGTVTRLKPSLMVHLENERLPMVFDERDFVLVDVPSSINLTGAE
jgi:hypothetical protein